MTRRAGAVALLLLLTCTVVRGHSTDRASGGCNVDIFKAVCDSIASSSMFIVGSQTGSRSPVCESTTAVGSNSKAACKPCAVGKCASRIKK